MDRLLPGGLGLRGKAKEWVVTGGLGPSGLTCSWLVPARATVLVMEELYWETAVGLPLTGIADSQRDCGKWPMWHLMPRRQEPAPSGCGCVDNALHMCAAWAYQSPRCETSVVSGPAGHSLPLWLVPRWILKWNQGKQQWGAKWG